MASVEGGVKVGADDATCDANKEGVIRYQDGAFQGCDSVDWFTILGQPTATPTASPTEMGGGVILQVYTKTQEDFGTRQNGPTHLETCSSFSSPGGGGRTVTNLDFTPKSATSWLLIESSPITTSEKDNVADEFRISARHAAGAPVAELRSKLFGWGSGAWSHEHNNPNVAYNTLRVAGDSWGTSPSEIVVRLSASGTCTGNHFFFNHGENANAKSGPLLFTVTEIEKDPNVKMVGAVKQLRAYVLNANGDEDANTGLSIAVGQRVALGDCGGMSQPPEIPEGRVIATIKFTPKHHASKIIIKGSPILIGELENISDDFRIAVYRSDGTRLGWNTGSYSYSNQNPNIARRKNFAEHHFRLNALHCTTYGPGPHCC